MFHTCAVYMFSLESCDNMCVCGYSVCIRLYDLIVVLYVCLVYVNISVYSTV